MKKILTIVLALAIGVGCNSLLAKGKKSFEGTISYTIQMSGDPSITSSMDMMPA